MEDLLAATGLVTLAEIGDKTQLLAFCLAARFRRPVPILLGILVATVLNHGLAAGLGVWLSTLLSPPVLRWVLGLSFLAMAVWMLVPDKIDDDTMPAWRFGVFTTTTAVFFLAEMGDKTQVATVALAARYASLWLVVAGTTVGMMIANVPAVYLGDRCGRGARTRLVRAVAAALAALLGIAVLGGFGEALGA